MSHGVKQCLDEVQSLRQRLAPSRWREEDWGIADHVLASYEQVLTALLAVQITLPQLLHLLRGQRRKPCPPGGLQASSSGANAAEQAAPADSAWQEETAVAAATAKPRGGHRPGTGRLGAAAYAGAKRVECRHEELAVGQVCPVCGRGRLYQVAPRTEMRIDGHALLSAVRYELERLRCSACGLVWSAKVPAEAAQDKYSLQSRAALVVGRYLLGLPFYRLQAYQAMLGVPVPDATQWDQIEQVADCAYVVFEQLEKEAAQGEILFQDDTAVRIGSLLKENLQLLATAEAQGLSKPNARTGMHTTALVVKVGEHTAILYYSSRRHAGENLQKLWDKREAGLEKPLAMSDALLSNEVADEAAVVRCHCLAHGRRQFSDLEAVFPQECQGVLEVIKQVFDHDEQARQEQMSAEARLAYHQAQSQPQMDELKSWLNKQMDEHLVEPNRALGKAIAYMQSHWETLTRFLSVPGAPLDNNLAERALKLFIRQRTRALTRAHTRDRPAPFLGPAAPGLARGRWVLHAGETLLALGGGDARRARRLPQRPLGGGAWPLGVPQGPRRWSPDAVLPWPHRQEEAHAGPLGKRSRWGIASSKPSLQSWPRPGTVGRRDRGGGSGGVAVFKIKRARSWRSSSSSGMRARSTARVLCPEASVKRSAPPGRLAVEAIG